MLLLITAGSFFNESFNTYKHTVYSNMDCVDQQGPFLMYNCAYHV